MMLAGMLNRTLVVQYRRSEVVRFYSPRLLLPLSQLRRCYGLHAILTTGEARRRNWGEKLTVEAVFCTVGNGTCIHEPGRALDGFAPLSEDVVFPASLQVNQAGDALQVELPTLALMALPMLNTATIMPTLLCSTLTVSSLVSFHPPLCMGVQSWVVQHCISNPPFPACYQCPLCFRTRFWGSPRRA